MKKIILFGATFIVAGCLITAGLFFLKLNFSSFPRRVDGLNLIEGPKLMTKKDMGGQYDGIYVGVYGISSSSKEIYSQTLYTIKPMSSEQEAKDWIRNLRESANAESVKNNEYIKTKIMADSPENYYFATVVNSQAAVTWASGKDACRVSAEAIKEPDGQEENARNVLNFAASLPNAPKGMTPPKDHNSFSLYGFVIDLPRILGFWYPVIAPLTIAIPFSIVMIVAFFWRGKKINTADSVG